VENSEPVRRNSEIEDPTNLYFIHPVSNRLVPLFARMGISPNAVSCAGMACGIGAGLAYFHYQEIRFALVGFFLMLAWHVMDGVDGQLARLTRSQSQVGKILDGICDYVTFTSVYASLALALSRQHGSWVWGLVAVAGIFHAIQSAVYEVQRQDYNFWAEGQKPVGSQPAGAMPARSAPVPLLQRIAHQLHRVYLGVQTLAIGVSGESRSKLGITLDANRERGVSVRRLYREMFAPALRRWSVMSANYRTLGLFVFTVLRRPLDYFLLEIFGLTALMIVLLYRQHLRYARFFKCLDATG